MFDVSGGISRACLEILAGRIRVVRPYFGDPYYLAQLWSLSSICAPVQSQAEKNSIKQPIERLRKNPRDVACLPIREPVSCHRPMIENACGSIVAVREKRTVRSPWTAERKDSGRHKTELLKILCRCPQKELRKRHQPLHMQIPASTRPVPGLINPVSATVSLTNL